jgi:hypothetical protein
LELLKTNKYLINSLKTNVLHSEKISIKEDEIQLFPCEINKLYIAIA